MLRVALLALLAVVAGCWTGSPSAPRDQDPIVARRPAKVVPVDAGVPDALDAAPPPVAAPCIQGRIVGIKVVTGGIEITVGVGSNSGVQPSWRAVYGNPNLPAKIVRVDARVTIVEMTGTPDQVQQVPYVHLCP